MYQKKCSNKKFLCSTQDTNKEIKKRTFSLPPELLIKIFQLVDSQSVLYTISLVCKQWLHCVAPILYSHPKINTTFSWATFILTLTRSKMTFFYGDLLRSIDLSSGKSIETMKDQEFYKGLTNSDTQPRIIRRNHQLQLEEQDYLMKGLPFIVLSTSSLLQLADTCHNLTSINLSYTNLLFDSLIEETGEYLSTLQHYAVQPGLTHIQIPIEQVIQTLGKACPQLKQLKLQRCEWVTAQVVWMFVYYCPNLLQLDARGSTKCSVKGLISTILEVPGHSFPTYEAQSSPSEIHEIHDNVDSHEDEDEEDMNAALHFRFNEETGFYEIVDLIPTRLLVSEQNNFLDENHRKNRTLKEIVYYIIMDAKHLGALDLNWLQDYSSI